MRAWVLHDIDNFKLESVEKPILADNEVLVAVKAVGICGSDIPRVYYSGTYSYPLVPGHEFSGVVSELGENVDRAWLGKRVGIFPLIPCRECGPCQKHQYEMCRNYSYLGSRRNGGFAEYVAVPVENLIELSEEVSFEEAAMLEPMSVAVHAMRRVAPSASDKIVICGLGTIGLLLLMFLQDAGLGKKKECDNILVIGNKAFQKKMALKLGVPENSYCDSLSQDVEKWIVERTAGVGADVFFECVGKNETLCQAVNCTAPGGKVMLVGNPYSDMKLNKAIYWKILRNQLIVMGTWNSSFVDDIEDDWHYALDRIVKRCIAPAELITHKYPLKELDKGLHIMRDKSEDYVKVMVESIR